jgi:hypothetical protein
VTTSRRDQEISACDPATPEAALGALAGHRNERVRAAVALNPAAPADLLLSLIKDTSDWVAGLAASHPTADRSVWEAAFTRGGRVLIDLVAVPWLDLDLAAAAAATGDAEVRESLAGHTAHPALLVQLAGDADPKVRAGVAGNRFAGQLWATLAKDPQRHVRAAVAGNPYAPDELMTTFATDRSADVRWATVSTHPHNPQVAAAFIDDPDPIVASHARQHLRAPAERTFEPDGSVRWQYPWENEAPPPWPVLDDPQADVLGIAAQARLLEVEARLRALG